MGCPCTRERTDNSVAIDLEDKNRLIEEAAARKIPLKKHLRNILHTEHWGIP